MVVADIPGLVEGAAEGKGLGHQFLRHIERARVMLIMVDLAEVALADRQEQERVLLQELGDYRADLLDRPRVVVGSRADLAAPEVLEAFGGLRLSAVTGEGVPPLLGALRRAVEEARAEEPEPEAFATLRPVAEGIRVERRIDGSFDVIGREAARAVALSDLTNPEALDVAQERMDRLGVNRTLARAGARNGDTVHIGRLTFTFEVEDQLNVQPFDEAPDRPMSRAERRELLDDLASDDWASNEFAGDDWDADVDGLDDPSTEEPVS
ncbi:MAG: Obg family GTPase CgtA [bacterium]